MSIETFTSEPTTVADKDSYLGDPNRSGASHGEAMFGDKQARLVALSMEDASPEGQAIAEKYIAGDETLVDNSFSKTARALAEHALTTAASAGDWDEPRIKLAKQQLDGQFPKVS
jgi:hypothetical protein